MRPKVIPPEDALPEFAEEIYRGLVDEWVMQNLREAFTEEGIEAVAKEFQDRFKLQDARTWIKRGFEHDDTQSWRTALKAALEAAYETKHKAAMTEAVREYVRENARAEDNE